MSEETCVYTACPGWGDHEYCALKTIVKDGKIVRTEKAEYTGFECDKGSICQKGLMSWRQVYSPERLLHPLKRIGERGEGKWEEISWDQALDEIAEKVKDIQAKYGTEAVAFWNIPASYPPNSGLEYVLTFRLAAALGATDPFHADGLDNGSEFSLQTDLGVGAYLMTDPAWMEDSDLILVWGANPIENQQRVTNAMMIARERGAKIYDIGLVYDATAGKSDWFIPVKPGSDAALALAMAKIIIEDDAYDREFLMNKTVAPLLVDTETGLFAHDADGNYLAWNEAAGALRAVPASTFDLPGDEIALTGCYDVDGKACKPAFQMLKEHLEPYTPEFSEEITGVPAQDCIKLARTLEESKAIFYMIAYGMRYRNQGEIHRAVTLLMALTGSDGYPGAGCGYSMVTSSWPILPESSRVMAPRGYDENGAIIGLHTTRIDEFFRGVLEGKYKALFVHSGNPVHNNPNRARWEKDTAPNLELLVDFDVWMTDTGELADYVLPDCMPFEREDIIAPGAYSHLVLQEPAIEPVGDNKPPVYYFSELAKRLGCGEFFDKTEDEWIDMMLEDTPAFVNADGSRITIEQLHKEKMVRPAVYPQSKFNATLLQEGFGTPSGRLEFYSDIYAPIGEAMAKYRPSIEFPIKEGAKYPYQFFTGRQRFFMQSMFNDDPVFKDLSGGEPFARMNPVDARREGLQSGDTIECYNDRGHVVLKLKLEEAVPPGMVHCWFGWRNRHYEDGMYSELLVPCGGDEANDELALFWWDQIMKRHGGVMQGIDTIVGGSWDTLWDVTCAVRKVEEGKE